MILQPVKYESDTKRFQANVYRNGKILVFDYGGKQPECEVVQNIEEACQWCESRAAAVQGGGK